MNIRKRDIKFFVFGLLTAIVIDVVWNWNQSIQDFMRGFNDGPNNAKIESDN